MYYGSPRILKQWPCVQKKTEVLLVKREEKMDIWGQLIVSVIDQHKLYNHPSMSIY